MNIRQIYSVTRRRAAGVLAVLTATAVAVAGSGDVSAQQPGQRSGMLDFLDGNTTIIQASEVRTAADVGPSPWDSVTTTASAGGVQLGNSGLAPGSIAQAVGTIPQGASLTSGVEQVGHCNTCPQPGGIGRFGGLGRLGYATRTYGNRFGGGCAPCVPYWYANFEGIYLRQTGEDNFTTVRNIPLEDSPWEWAPRFTTGYVPDCVNGYEFSFTGPIELERETIATGPVDSLNSFFSLANPPDPNFDPIWIEPFNGASYLRQYYETEYWSLEASKTLVGWDVVKLLIGPRFINFEEIFQLDGVRTFGGRIQNQTRNRLFGGQVGLEMLYPTGRFCYTDLRARAGLYYNVAETDALIYHQGALVQANSTDDNDFAGAFEFGGGMRFQCGEMLSVRIGGEAWYIAGLATAQDQITPVLTSGYGRRMEMDDDVFFIGLTVGAELKF